MEMMPSHPERDGSPRPGACASGLPSFGVCGDTGDWRAGLPDLRGAGVELRELRIDDAKTLFEQLTPEDVSRFVSSPPSSVAGFEKFIRWSHGERAAGRHLCFAVVPEGQSAAAGIFQIRVVDSEQRTTEWGFALGAAFWGTGIFVAAAQLVIDFAFRRMDALRLEARACLINERGNGALLKMGAVREAVLHRSFVWHGGRLDQGLWAIHRHRWRPPLTGRVVTVQ